MSGKEIIPEVLPQEKRQVGRPAKVLSMIPKRSLAERAAKANQYHNSAAAAYAQASYFAVMCGLELLAAKAQCQHGEWIPWVEANCEFTDRAASKYMSIAELAMPRLQGGQPAALIDVAPSQMPAADRKALVKSVADLTEGKSIRELQMDLQFDIGSLRVPVDKPTGGAREGAGRPKHDEAHYNAKVEQARVEWEIVAQGIGTQMKKGSYRLLKREMLAPLVAILANATNELDHHLTTLK
jgi:hypothetical protein